MEIVKVAFIALLTVLFYALLRQIKPEIAPLIIIGGAAVIIIMLSESLLGLTSDVDDMMSDYLACKKSMQDIINVARANKQKQKQEVNSLIAFFDLHI